MFTTINGCQVNYEVSGNGRPIVLLHGWGTSLRLFDSVVAFLSKHFKVYTLDFPGFGKSEEPEKVWTVFDYANMTERFLEIMDIKNPILMGHSFGGRVSIILGAQRKIHKIILVDSAGVKPTRGWSYYRKVYLYKLMRNIEKFPGMRFFFGDLFDAYRTKAGSSDYKSASPMMRKILSSVVNDDLQHLMPKITAPTLLVWGSQDTATPVSDAKIMESQINGSALVVLEGAGHYSYLEQPQAFQSIVESFLEEDLQ